MQVEFLIQPPNPLVRGLSVFELGGTIKI